MSASGEISPNPAPTVGRIVHYALDPRVDSAPRAAIITGVNLDGTIELEVFHRKRDGRWVDRHDAVEYDANGMAGTWRYPPRV